jgi:hypothetical protein
MLFVSFLTIQTAISSTGYIGGDGSGDDVGDGEGGGRPRTAV